VVSFWPRPPYPRYVVWAPESVWAQRWRRKISLLIVVLWVVTPCSQERVSPIFRVGNYTASKPRRSQSMSLRPWQRQMSGKSVPLPGVESGHHCAATRLAAFTMQADARYVTTSASYLSLTSCVFAYLHLNSC
jgi:hypothetical protein